MFKLLVDHLDFMKYFPLYTVWWFSMGIYAYMPTVQIKEEHSSFWEKIIIILMQVFLFLYKFVCIIE